MATKRIRHTDPLWCPTCGSRQRPGCTTCLVNRRRANEPDTWYYRPRTIQQAANAVTLKHSGRKSRVTDPWALLEQRKAGADPVDYDRAVLVQAIHWGVNVDAISVPWKLRPVQLKQVEAKATFRTLTDRILGVGPLRPPVKARVAVVSPVVKVGAKR